MEHDDETNNIVDVEYIANDADEQANKRRKVLFF